MRLLLASSALAIVAGSMPTEVSLRPSTILRRSDDSDDSSVCHCYGIDFQNEGSYFINSQSNAQFTCVSQFENSQGDPAYIILIRDDEDDDQWECTSVPTTPDNTAQLSTCPITKDQMTTGNWSIITMGNNNNGTAFAWQRNFYLSVGVPETTTITPTVTFTQTTTPSATVTSTSTVVTTTSVNNTLTVTSAASTISQTVTPACTTTTSTNMITRTSNTWTKTLSKTSTVVTPTCTIPTRPYDADPPASHTPTVVAIPVGVKIISNTKRTLSPSRKRFESHRAAEIRAELQQDNQQIARRSPDAPTLTSTASVPVNTTTTLTASTATFTDTFLVTSTATITGSPITITQGVTRITITAATPTKTSTEVGYTTEVFTRTMAQTWTYTSFTTPAPDATACKSEGGHFGHQGL